MSNSVKMFFTACCAIVVFRAPSAFACDVTLSPGGNIQAALNTPSVHSVCLLPGTYWSYSNIVVNAGQLLIGTGNTDDAKIISISQYPVILQSNATVARLTIEGAAGHQPDYGVIVGNVSGATAWGLRIRNTRIGIGANGASNATFLSNYISQNGVQYDGIASPSFWINSSSNVLIQYGEIQGSSENGGGDGEIAAYHSTNVVVSAVYLNWSGAAGVYMVNCDSCRVENSYIRYSGEFGLDIVDGSDNFIARNNEVSHSRYGGAIFTQTTNAGGEFTGNNFMNNRFEGPGCCLGVSVIGDMNVPNISGNTPIGPRMREKCQM